MRDRPERKAVDYHNITPPELFARWEPDLVHGLAWGRHQLAELGAVSSFALADSAFNEAELTELGYLHTAVVPILLDLATFEHELDDACLDRLLERKHRDGGVDLLFVGRLAPNKAQHELVKVLAAYRRLYDGNARLRLVGGSSSDRYEQAIRSFAVELDLADAVDLAGAVTAGELAAYYRTADVLVSASVHEGFCVPLLEAMHHRVPIVARAEAAVPETLGDAGVLLRSGAPDRMAAAVHRVVTDPLATRRRGRRASARCASRRGRDSGARRLDAIDARRAGRAMKVAFVTPRYGDEVVGGAELGARMLAERLVSQCGWEVEALTTCALDATTWADSYPAGTSDLRGVTVRRFASASGRSPDFDAFSTRVLRAPQEVSEGDERRWIELQGPVSPGLIDAIHATDAERVIFYPYLYHPTVCGIFEAGERAVMHPAAHDELPIRLPVFRRVFNAARGLAYHTEAERRFVESLFPVAHHREIVIGLGSDPQPGDPHAAREQMGLDERPYLLCLGRVDDGKGAAMLARFFLEYKRRHPGPLRLVFVGPVVHRPPEHDDIVVAGPVGEATKWGALRGAVALVSPSAYESFSLVLLEAWNAGVPVVVNARCEATREHVLRSGGGLWFRTDAEFEVACRSTDRRHPRPPCVLRTSWRPVRGDQAHVAGDRPPVPRPPLIRSRRRCATDVARAVVGGPVLRGGVRGRDRRAALRQRPADPGRRAGVPRVDPGHPRRQAELLRLPGAGARRARDGATAEDR